MIGDINSTLPCGQSHLIDRTSEVVHSHGGIVTAFQFDTLEEMSLEDFMKDVLPKLGKDSENLTIIKDPFTSNIVRILKDNVAVYHITGMQDVFFDSFIERLQMERPVRIQPNLQYPLVEYSATGEGKKAFCVAIPARQFTYHPATRSLSPFVIWHPTLWLYVRLTAANIPDAVRIGAVLERREKIEETQIYRLPFPNIYDNGNICFGGTRFDKLGTGELTVAAAIEMTYQRLFNSEFNFDLMSGTDIRHMISMYESMPVDKEYDTKYNKSSDSNWHYLVALSRVFKEQAGMLKFNYQPMCNGDRFLGRDH